MASKPAGAGRRQSIGADPGANKPADRVAPKVSFGTRAFQPNSSLPDQCSAAAAELHDQASPWSAGRLIKGGDPSRRRYWMSNGQPEHPTGKGALRRLTPVE